MSRHGMGSLGVKVGWGRRVSSPSHGGDIVGEIVGLLPVLPSYESSCIRGLVVLYLVIYWEKCFAKLKVENPS